MDTKLDTFIHTIDTELTTGMWADTDLPVVNTDGHQCVVFALKDEHVAHMIERVETIGGDTNIFIDMDDHVALLGCLHTECAILPTAETTDTISPGDTVENLIDRLREHDGHVIPLPTVGEVPREHELVVGLCQPA